MLFRSITWRVAGRALLAIVPAALLAAAIAQPAQAHPRRHFGYWSGGYHRPYARARHFYAPVYHPRFAPAPRLAFHFAVTNAPPYGYRYYDPYCRRSFFTLDLFLAHAHRHPRVVRVLALEAGYPSYALCYQGGRWVYWD